MPGATVLNTGRTHSWLQRSLVSNLWWPCCQWALLWGLAYCHSWTLKNRGHTMGTFKIQVWMHCCSGWESCGGGGRDGWCRVTRHDILSLHCNSREQNPLGKNPILMLKVTVLRWVESLPMAGIGDMHLCEWDSLFLSAQQKLVSPDTRGPQHSSCASLWPTSFSTHTDNLCLIFYHPLMEACIKTRSISSSFLVFLPFNKYLLNEWE